jgi:uncharacterized protein YjeT (DUF2065 family)
MWNTVFLVLGVVALLEGLVATFFPKWARKIGVDMLKSIKNVRKIGIIEVIIALILILIGMNI